MKREQRLAVSSIGDPRNPRTWSGTPANVINALERQSHSVVAVNAGVSTKLEKAVLYLAYQSSRLSLYSLNPRSLVYQLSLITSEARSDFSRARIARSRSAARSRSQSRAAGCTKVLHMTTVSLPLSTLDSDVSHYLMCDSTWNTMFQFSKSIDRYTVRMLREVEELERESFAQIEHFFPTAEYVRDDLIDHYGIEPRRITVVGTGRGNIAAFEGEKDYANGHILCVAKVRFEEKGGPLLIEAFKIAQAANPKLKLVLVGQEQYRQLLVNTPNVILHGHLSWAELQSLFNGAALYAMPAMSEPWGLVYLEALACKTPLLGMNRNALPEIMQHGRYGFLVDEPKPEQVADALLQAFSDSQRLRQMGETGQKHCLENYSWDHVAAKIARVVFR